MTLSWNARGHTTLYCGSGSPLNGQVAQIRQHIEAHIERDGRIVGHGPTHISIGNRHLSFEGRYIGTTTINQGTLAVQADYNGDRTVDAADFVVWRIRLKEHGTIDLGAKQFTSHVINSVVFDTSTKR